VAETELHAARESFDSTAADETASEELGGVPRLGE
jgi:hypothetical protein